MPWRDPAGRVSSHTAWRAVIVLLALAVAGTYVLIPKLFTSNRKAIVATTELSCRLGTFFVGSPIVAEPQQTPEDFQRTLKKAAGFLRALRMADCSEVKGATISDEQVKRALDQIRRARDSSVPGGP